MMHKRNDNFSRMVNDEVFITTANHDASMAAVDLMKAVGDWRLYVKRAWNEIKLKYSRSTLGPLWEVATTIAFVFGFALLGSYIFGQDRITLVAYLTAGIIFWQFFVVNLNEAANAFIAYAGEINTRRTSFTGLIFNIIIRNVLVMAHNLPLLLLVAFFTDNFSVYTLYFLPGLISLILIFFPINLFVAMMTVRYRDAKHAISMVMQFLFYFTPIFWPSDQLSEYPERLFVMLNPFYHMLEVVRAPSLGKAPELINYIVLGVIFILAILVSTVTFIRFRKRIVYWL